MEWINVKDRLPSEDGRYLVCTKSSIGKFVKIISYALNYDCPFSHEWMQGRALWYAYGEVGDYEIDNVTHWMPLPELPNED